MMLACSAMALVNWIEYDITSDIMLVYVSSKGIAVAVKTAESSSLSPLLGTPLISSAKINDSLNTIQMDKENTHTLTICLIYMCHE